MQRASDSGIARICSQDTKQTSMELRQQIGGVLTLGALAVMAGASGWWWLARGGVVDRIELFSQQKVAVFQAGGATATVGTGDGMRGEWRLGPYSLTPEDSPINVLG